MDKETYELKVGNLQAELDAGEIDIYQFCCRLSKLSNAFLKQETQRLRAWDERYRKALKLLKHRY